MMFPQVRPVRGRAPRWVRVRQWGHNTAMPQPRSWKVRGQGIWTTGRGRRMGIIMPPATDTQHEDAASLGGVA